jgi:hypothetical protein
MKTKLAPLAVSIALLMPAVAFAEVMLTPEVELQIKDTLSAQGYEVGKIKIEDGMYEAYAKKDGKKYEVFLNEKLEIVKTKDD